MGEFGAKYEATELAINAFGRKVDKKKINQSRYLLDTLKKLKMKNLIITAGDKGAYGLDEKGHYYFKPARKTKKVDTVGAGDAFASGFLSEADPPPSDFPDFLSALIISIQVSQ